MRPCLWHLIPVGWWSRANKSPGLVGQCPAEDEPLPNARISLRSFRSSRLENLIPWIERNWAGRLQKEWNSSSKEPPAPEGRTKQGLCCAELPDSSRAPSSMGAWGNSAAATAGKRLQGMLEVSSAKSSSHPLTRDAPTFSWWGARLCNNWKGKAGKLHLHLPDPGEQRLTASKSKVKTRVNSELQ